MYGCDSDGADHDQTLERVLLHAGDKVLNLIQMYQETIFLDYCYPKVVSNWILRKSKHYTNCE